MSVRFKGKIFFVQPYSEDDVVFYKVERSTTNTCEVSQIDKVVVFQNEDFQYVEPGERTLQNKQRCRVLNSDLIEFKSGELAQPWDGKPIKQTTIIFLPIF